MQKRWIVGLGNPGKKYEKTRHNIGFRVLDALGPGELREKHHSLYARKGGLTLIYPQTFMNESGKALAEWKRRDGMEVGAGLLVVYDDMDLPPGKIRLRESGSGGSHNGMASIIEHLGTEAFHRLRLGVGKPGRPEDWADYVLKPAPPSEREAEKAMIGQAAEIALAWAASDSVGQLKSRFKI